MFGKSRGRFGLTGALAAALVMIISGCAGPEGLVSDTATPPPAPAAREFFLRPLNEAWTAQPSGLVLTQRRAPRSRQQIIGLANETTLRGDNFMLLVAYGSPAHVPRSFRLETVLETAGGVPYPFEELTDSDLNRQRDSLGTFFWKEFDTRTGVACVLAIRRLDYETRMLPANTAAMEVVLRNCVPGSAREALAPMRPDRLAVAFRAASINGGVRPRVLNPLAAPEL